MQPIGACILVINDQNQVLLGKRKNSYKAGYYGIPGGRVEVGELLAETAKRELLEETNLTAVDLKYVGVVKEHQDEWDFIHFVFVCHQWTGEVTTVEPEKCEGWQWYDLKALPSPILEGHAAAIKVYKEKKTLVEL
ncbi:MAG TPA: NUDIX domain-containing protein [Patescibacteria group bacterium]